VVEVFKTDIKNQLDAVSVQEKLHEKFSYYKVNFDMADEDNILRVECFSNNIDVESIVQIVRESGFCAEPLSDDIPNSPAFLLFDNMNITP
jgi:hypothetical protein